MHNLNNKAFSLVELLAVIAILGFLSTMAVIGISRLLERARVNHYSTQEKSLVMASQAYLANEKNLSPKDIGSSRIIELKELQDSKVIGDVLDYNKEKCIPEESYVKVTKYSKSKYSYQVYLNCPNYSTNTSETSNFNGPDISFDFSKLLDNHEVYVDIEDKDQILNYEYTVYSGDNDNKEVILTGSKKDNSIGKSFQEKLNISEYIPNDLSIIFKSTDIYGNESVASIDKKINDITPPICGEIKLDDKQMSYDNDTKSWLNVNTGLEEWSNAEARKVSVACIDLESGCKNAIYEKTLTQEESTNFVEIENNEGIKTNCIVPVNIDRTSPIISRVYNPYENEWTNKNYKIIIDGSDENSGINYYAYNYKNSTREGENDWHIYNNSSTSKYTTPSFSTERDMEVSFMACDKAGNCSDGETISHIKIDKTAPIIKEIINPYEETWTNKEYSINIKADDVEPQYGDGSLKYNEEKIKSGIDHYEYNYPESEITWLKYKNSKNTEFSTPKFVNDRNDFVNFRVCDKANNCSDSYSSKIMIDKIAPICNVSGGSEKWINAYSEIKTRTIKAECSDSLGITNSGCLNESIEKEYNYDIETDKAGVEGVNLGGYVSDLAGNKTKCLANQIVKIDTTLPTCGKAKGSSKKWTSLNRTIKQECNDNLSGCVKETYNKKYNKGKTTKDSIEIFDKAGNNNFCLYNVYVDKDK